MASSPKERTDKADDEAIEKSILSPIDALFGGKKPSLQPSVVQRRLLPLLPKPVLPLKSKPAFKPLPLKRKVSPVPGPCGIPRCQQRPCRLGTHRKYVQARRYFESRREISSLHSSSQPTTRQGSHNKTTPEPIALNILETGFPVLPLPKTEEHNPILRRMFQDFFHLIDRLHIIVVAPFPGYSTWLKRRSQTLFELGTERQLDCLNFMGASYVYHSARSGIGSLEKDPTALLLQSLLVKTFREVLETHKSERDVDRLLTIIFTLVILDMNATHGKQVTSLLGHRMAMTRLVDSVGGIHNLGPAVSFTLSMDRALSIQTGLEPLYTSWDSVTLPLSRAQLYPQKYGSFFSNDTRSHEITPDVIDYCEEVSRAIEILEGEKWQFDGEIRETTAELYYLYYLRDRIGAKFAHLHARTYQDRSRTRFILLAAKIVDYMVLFDNYLAAQSITIAHRLRDLVENSMDPDMWTGWEDVKLWIAFVLACVPSFWEGHAWAIAFCRKSLEMRYGKLWPPGWRKRELENMYRFLWSSSRLDPIFDDICIEVDSSAAKTNSRSIVRGESFTKRPPRNPT